MRRSSLVAHTEQRRRRQERELSAIEESKTKLAKEYGLERNAKFEKAWRFAWDLGHSEGISEVELYFGELAELIRP